MKRGTAIVLLILVTLASAGLALYQAPRQRFVKHPGGTGQAPLRRWRTLASLRRVDDYPLYVMHYYGDYGFDAFLERGIRRSRASLTDPEMAQGWACTGFAAMSQSGDAIMGRNFDWRNRETMLLFTDPPGGYASVSTVDVSYLGYPGKSPSWASRAKLLDAPYWPFDGLNERGLAVGMMAVPHAEDRDDPNRVTIGSLHAIRLMLDHAANVEEAIALLQDYRIDLSGVPIHYLIADPGGHAAVVEYIAGEMTVTRNETPWQVSTNFILAREKPEGANSSCWRYNRAYERLARTEGALTQAEALSLLEDVSQPNTVWSVVYNMTAGEIEVTMGRNYTRVHTFKLDREGK